MKSGECYPCLCSTPVPIDGLSEYRSVMDAAADLLGGMPPADDAEALFSLSDHGMLVCVAPCWKVLVCDA